MKRSELQFPLMDILLVLVLLLTVAAAQAPAPKEVPVTEEPSHHLVLENQYTRTYQVEVGPGKATLLHRHDHDYVFVVIGDADISNEVLGKPPVEQKLKDGDVEFAPGGFAHVARNLAPTPFRNVTIEVVRKSQSRPHGGIGSLGDGTLAGGVFATDAVQVMRYEIGPGHILPLARDDREYLFVAVSALHLKKDIPGKGSSQVQQKAGDIVWAKPEPRRTLTNPGSEPARFVIVEFR